MSNVVPFPIDRGATARGELHLGPAIVVAVHPDEVEVRLDEGQTVQARLALASPYEPALEDVLLVIGTAKGFYVIGVLHGRGTTSLAFQGDVELRAMGGALRIGADKGVEVRSPEVTIAGAKLRMMADAAVQTFATVRQRVTELLSVHAAARHTVVDGASHEQAKSATILTEEKMTINGKAIYLG